MAKEIFKNLPDTSTPLNATKLNGLFDGAESMGSIVVEDVTCKNLFNPSRVLAKGNLSVSGDKISSTGIAGATWSYENAQYYDTLQAGTYTLSMYFSTQETSQYGAIFIVDSGGNWITTSQIAINNLDKKVISFTLTKETKIGIQLKLSNGVCKIQIEKGSVGTNYVEHKEFGNKNPELIWNGNHYTTGNNNIQYFGEPLIPGKQYIFVVQGLSGSFRMSFPYIYGTGNEIQFSYYDGTTVVRWRIGITGDGSGFYLSDGSMNMGSNTSVRQIYKVN